MNVWTRIYPILVGTFFGASACSFIAVTLTEVICDAKKTKAYSQFIESIFTKLFVHPEVELTEEEHDKLYNEGYEDGWRAIADKYYANKSPIIQY